MQYSVREAKARFAEAIGAAARGEKVVVTRHGVPFVEIVPATPVPPVEAFAAKAARVQQQLGIDPEAYVELDDDFMAWFNDPALSRRLLGIED